MKDSNLLKINANRLNVFGVISIIGVTFFTPISLAQCPGEDTEPAMSVKVKNGTTLFVCGFEDREVPGTKGKRAFSDFGVFYELAAKDEPGDSAHSELKPVSPTAPPVAGSGVPAGAVKGAPPNSAAHAVPTPFESLKAFASDPNETYWVKEVPGKGLEIEELWFFSERPTPALKQEITCTADACTATAQKCMLKMKPNPFPKALAEFKKRMAASTLKDDGEELIDQIFAQAFLGDRAAKDFYATPPANLDPALAEAFTTNQKKLAVGCKK